MTQKYTAHVVSHTHWDREWYKPFQHYRMRLIELTDALIELMETTPSFKYFTFDGQTIVLEDYLKIRPENEARLRKLTQDGRIQLGPWYNQPDEFIVSGESIIRNLLQGKKLCEDFGGYLKIGYVPDSFGHISQLPQIFRGFGIDSAVIFRGITTDQVKSEFTWRATDGSEVLAIKLPDNNAYSNWFYRLRESLRFPDKPVDAEQATEEVKALIEDSISEKPTTSQLLFMDGCDHVFAQFKTPQIIEIANERLDNVEIRHSTLPAYVESVRAENPDLEVQAGELRWSNREWKLQSLLTNVLSSRIHLKQANAECETLLEKYVEPLYSWLSKMGVEYPKSYIDLAWNYLLKNSPHDSICGCSIDQVHRDMMYRYDQCRLICERLIKKGLANLAGRIDAEVERPERTVHATVFNPLAQSRTDIVETEIDLPGDWNIPGVRVIDSEEEEIECAILGFKHYGTLEPEPYDIPLGEHRQKMKLAFVAENVPGVGYKTYRIEALEKPNREPGTMLLGPDSAENEYISITVSADGTLYLLDKETDAVYTDCLIFEDGGDFGDGYNYTKPLRDNMVTSLGANTRVSVVENNAVRVVFEIVSDLELPAARHSNGQERSEETVTCRVKTYVTLTAGLRRLDIKTVFDNRANDHRLRVLFPTGILAKTSHAEGAFDVIERSIAVPPCRDWREPMPSTHPQKTFADINGSGIGLTLINKGLPEFEVKDDEARTMALTLLRATGNGVMGPDYQSEGQLLGEHTFEFALYPHAGNWEEAASYMEAHAFNTPLVVGQSSKSLGNLPLENGFVSIDNDKFVLSAVKPAENGDGQIIRGFNIGTEPIDVRISIKDITTAELVDLKEDKIDSIEVKDECLEVPAAPKHIISIRVR